jgi:hypothetical protein
VSVIELERPAGRGGSRFGLGEDEGVAVPAAGETWTSLGGVEGKHCPIQPTLRVIFAGCEKP